MLHEQRLVEHGEALKLDRAVAKGAGLGQPPAWAAREAMVAAAMATTEDLRRWDRAFEATAQRPATLFAPMLTAIGRRPA